MTNLKIKIDGIEMEIDEKGCTTTILEAAKLAGIHIPTQEDWLELNRKYSETWPNITARIDPLPDADDWEKVPDKLAEHFSPNPGKGG